MNIPINKDFEHDYKSSVWKGFTLVEMAHLCIGVAVAVGLCLVLWLVVKLPVVPSIYISIPVGFPILASGFWKSVNGLNLWQYRKAIRYRKATQVLHYNAGEYKPVPETFFETDQWKSEAQRKKIQKMRRAYKKRDKKIKHKEVFEAHEDKEVTFNENKEVTAISPGKKTESERMGGPELYLNPFEIPEEIIYSTDLNIQNHFIRQKTDFVEECVYSCGAEQTQTYKNLIDRSVQQMYEQAFRAKKRKSPVLREFCQILLEQSEPEAKDLYTVLEPYVNGTYDIFAHDSSQNINDRMIVSGKRNLPSEIAETYMLTAMHLLSIRMDYKSSLEGKD